MFIDRYLVPLSLHGERYYEIPSNLCQYMSLDVKNNNAHFSPYSAQTKSQYLRNIEIKDADQLHAAISARLTNTC